MSDADDSANNLVAAGALYMLLATTENAALTRLEAHGNVLLVGFSFLNSPYKVTIERIPESERQAASAFTDTQCSATCSSLGRSIACGLPAGHDDNHVSADRQTAWVDAGFEVNG